MPTTRSLTRGGITWGFTHDVTYGEYANGDYWVLGGPLGGVEVSSISPQCVLGGPISISGFGAPLNNLFQDGNGSMLNPHWRNVAELFGITSSGTFINGQYSKGQGYNGSGGPSELRNGYSRLLNWALVNDQPISNANRKVLPVNSSLVSTDSSLPGNQIKLKRSAVLTCVSAVPPVGAFRPAFNTLDKTHYITSGDIDYNLLGNVQASSVSSLMPSSSYVSGILTATSGVNLIYQAYDYIMWSFATYNNQMGYSYGADLGMFPSIAIGYINTNLLSQADKIRIANNIIQHGIDCWGNLQRCVGHPIGYSRFIGGGGGHNQGLEMPLMFLGGILRFGSQIKETIKTVLTTAKNLGTFLSHKQFYEVKQIHVNANALDIIPYPNLYQYSASICLQPSDIGSIQFMHGDYDEFGAVKLFGPEEFAALTNNSTWPGWGPFATSYRHCCTSIIWGPFLFAVKAMGIEKTLGHDLLCRYYESYYRRQRYGPNSHTSTTEWINASKNLRLYFGNNENETTIGSLASNGLVSLYDSLVKHSYQSPKGTGDRGSYTPVSGVESLGLSTDPTIYIEAPSSFRPGINNTVKCYGVSGYTWPDLLLLVFARTDYWLDNPVDLFGAKFHLAVAEGQIPFTSVVDGVATVNVPVNPVSVGGENIIQVISVRAVNGQLEIKTTNALKVKILP